jgi:hypothetical protein
MREDDRSAADGSPDATLTVAERWRLPALDILQRWTLGRRWLTFAAAVEERHLAVFVRSNPKRRDQRQGVGAGLPDLGDVPAGLGTSNLIYMGAARQGVASAPRPAGAPARPRQSRLQTRRPGFWPEASRPAPPGLGLPTAVPRRSVSAEAYEAQTGARIDHRLSAGVLHGLAHTLDPHVQGWLSRLLDLRIPAVRIHTGQAADATTRRFNADAVSFGPDIVFRAGRFAPDSASGLGLLGHELTHVAHTESDRFAGPPDRTALDREEAVAIANEKRVLQHATGKSAMTGSIAAMPLETSSRAMTRPPTPRAASVDRGAVPPPGGSDASTPPPELTAQQLGALKEAVYRDLLDRIRTEFERGA